MKQYVILFALAAGCILYGCNSYNYDLEKMGEAVQSHLKYKDIDNGTKTTINYLKAISYEEIPEPDRKQPDEYYLCKVYVKGTWAYDNSYRIFNLDDTLNCYFSKSKTFLRMDKTITE
ncbi:putative SAM-dependent methyltransferase [Dysgonomonas hofstadii]|uniref:Putative SAM-dependent methyltransferase n=1 Tax=Dysgonomonas hofstadii TaxID=637886 RepID=A0A840CMG6_9BACT|nr:hypothetical protein [Dysgonomonas hofstadii]MBB4035889.1 putative SAM-dependent methyltransferase [Dysgonomonas hofstadii]